MPRSAVTMANSAEPGGRGQPAPDTGLQKQLSMLGRQMGGGRGFRPTRSQVVVTGLVIVGVWLFLVFGRTLTDLNVAEDHQAALADEAAALELRLEAGRREQVLVQTDAFQALQARGFGLGEPGEQVFALASDAPPPPVIVPLGGLPITDRAETTLDAWLGLLFGG